MMRRLMWQMNDECGGIGWGVPEVMGEAMAQSEELALEFAPILLSYITKDGNYLEYEPLQRGALWGLGRLGQAHPRLLQDLGAARHLLPFLKSPDAAVRGLAVWALGWIGAIVAEAELQKLADDFSTVQIFMNGKTFGRPISEWVHESLHRIRSGATAA